MILKQIKKEVNGDTELIFAIDPFQLQVLINYAIQDLISKGLIKTLELSSEDVEKIEKEHEENMQKMFLEQTDAKDLPQA